MATGARNRSKYAKPDNNQSLEDDPESCTREFLEQCWRAARKRDPIKDNYDLSDDCSLNGEATAAALIPVKQFAAELGVCVRTVGRRIAESQVSAAA